MAHTFKDWIETTRYWSFSVSAFPVLATAAYLCATYGFAVVSLLNTLLAVVGAVLFHAAGNLLSDVGDYKSGADSPEAFAVRNLIEHRFECKEYLRLSAVLFILGILVGLFLTWRCGWELLIIGGLGFLFTLLYTKSKNVLMSDLDIFVIFGIIIVLGTSFVATGRVCFDTLLLSIPLGIITLSVLHANNTLDIKTDQAVGIRTIAIALGAEKSAKLYIAYQIIPFAWVALCVIFGLMPWTALLSLVAFAAALGNIRQASKFKTVGIEAMKGLDLCSAKLQLIFSLTLSIGLFIAAFF